MAQPKHELRFGSHTQWWRLPIQEIVQSGTLFSFLMWKEVHIRYRQTSMGMLWIIIQPILEMAVFTMIFGHIFDQYAHVPYALFVYAGLVPWVFFASGVMSATSSLVSHATMIKKIYFPRMVIPLAIVLSKGIDFLVSLFVLFILMMIYGVALTPTILLMPIIFLLLYIAASGVSLWTSALHGMYRDVALVVPYFMRIGMFLTPVIYPLRSVDERWQALINLNPLSGLIVAFRDAMLGGNAIDWNLLALDTVIILAIFISGLFFFRKMEGRLLDIL